MAETITVASSSSPSPFEALSPLPQNAAVTMAYVPFQTDKRTYDDDDALKYGTLFRTLNKPFERGAVR